jgi:hypothetical protein
MKRNAPNGDSRDAGSIEPVENADRFRRSPSTALFWIVVSILVGIGLCVLVSLLLVLVYGS